MSVCSTTTTNYRWGVKDWMVLHVCNLHSFTTHQYANLMSNSEICSNTLVHSIEEQHRLTANIENTPEKEHILYAYSIKKKMHLLSSILYKFIEFNRKWNNINDLLLWVFANMYKTSYFGIQSIQICSTEKSGRINS